MCKKGTGRWSHESTKKDVSRCGGTKREEKYKMTYTHMHTCFLLSNSSTASSSSASTSPTRSCSSSSIITCLSSNKKNTRRRALSGPSLILAWTCSHVSIWSRRYNKTTNDGSILANKNPTDGCSAGSKKK